MERVVRREVRDPWPTSAYVSLPQSDAMLDRVAANFCLAIQPLFQTIDPEADPVLIATFRDPATGSMRLRCWDRSVRERDIRLDPARRHDRHILRAATVLSELLSVRWPEPIRPARIGMLSDGTGVAIAPEDPCPARSGWIARRLADPHGLIALKRFAPDGGLALLQAPRPALRAPH